MQLGKPPCSQHKEQLEYLQQFKAILAVDNAASRLGGLTLATTILPAQAPAGRIHDNDDVFYLFLQKQKIGAKLHIPLDRRYVP